MVVSQISNMAPLVAFLLYAGTEAFADFIFILLLGQLLWPLLTVRMDIQIQIELYSSRQDYVLGLGLWLLITFALIGTIGVFLYQGAPSQLMSDPLFGGLAMGIALSIQGLARAWIVARSRSALLYGFETLNVAKNLGALALSDKLSEYLTPFFVWTNVVHGALLLVLLYFWIGKLPRLRALWHFISPSVCKGMRFRARRVLVYSFPNSFIGMATARLPLLAIEATLPVPVSAGFLAASRMALSPLNFLIYALRILGVIEINKRRAGQQNRFSALVGLISIGTPLLLSPLLLPIVASDWLVPLVSHFDSSWQDALDYLPMIYPWAVLFMMTGWLDRVFDITGTQRIILIIELFMLVLMSAISLGIWFGLFQGMLALWIVALVSAFHGACWGIAFVYIEKARLR